ncbi:efflux RND transporter periplasmic adaptor subunit [Fundidesulfovibrio agrisoli]|uniref:efflux RND transporter periplasmic adaptor subunit n=1 Tax=Fundidesulfovibrio agrisoli TaxID=2922717 RepID=UPI001FACDFE1|nr:HlyD family efflux transporter periplasmic adaptor subunit [Fundidesulfovibrio agrisoli]
MPFFPQAPRKPRPFGPLLALAVALALLAGACDKPGGTAPAVLEWGEATVGDVLRVIEAPGVVKARPEGLVRVGSRLKGQVILLTVRTGDIVRKGQLLAQLDNRELTTQRDQAKARLDAAVSEYERTEALFAGRLEEARAAIAAGRGKLDYAARGRERRDALRSQGHISQDALDASRRDEAVAAQTVRAGQAALERIGRERDAELARTRRELEATRAELELSEVYLSMTRLESPIDGIVGQVHTQEGEQVVAELETVNIVTVIDPRYLELWVYINEAEAAAIRKGTPVRFFRPARKEQVFEARVERVSPAPETVGKVLYYPAIVPLAPLSSLELRPDMNVQCLVKMEEAGGDLSVPNEAVVARGGKRLIYVDDGRGGVKPVEPQLGLKGNQRTQVLSGLERGQRVALKLAP